jgi:hypothetical protein
MSMTTNQTFHQNGSDKAKGILASLSALAAISTLMQSCKKEKEALFEINEVALYSSAADKDKEKTNAQYISILYTNLFQSAISSNQVFELDEAFRSIGDQEIAKEVLISNFFNNPTVALPSVDLMNADMDGFIIDTYKRFLLREPNEAEKLWVKNFIQSHPYVTPEIVYFSFALCNEYKYY